MFGFGIEIFFSQFFFTHKTLSLRLYSVLLFPICRSVIILNNLTIQTFNARWTSKKNFKNIFLFLLLCYYVKGVHAQKQFRQPQNSTKKELNNLFF